MYLSAEEAKQKSLLKKVGKHSMGRSCLYFRRFADLDKKVLEKVMLGSIAEMRRIYG